MRLWIPILLSVAVCCSEPTITRAAVPKRMKGGGAAEQGTLALACYYGFKQRQDFHQAVAHARLGAGDPSATIVEALCLGRGRGVAQDLPRAIRLLAPLTAQGNPFAHAATALIMGHGRSAEVHRPNPVTDEFKEESSEFPTFSMAERSGHARLALSQLAPRLKGDWLACLVTGQVLAWGVGIAKNEARAEQLFREAFHLGCSDGANLLGNLFKDGEMARRDEAEAAKWYREGMKAGNATAGMNLTLLKEFAAEDASRHLELITTAAEAGQPQAMQRLGYEHWVGLRMPPDLLKAREWLEKAVAAGDKDAMAQLGKLLRDTSRDETERLRGTKLWRRAVVRGSEIGFTYLSRLYLEGDKSVPANPHIGFVLASIAVAAGNHDAWASLGLAYQNGAGVKKDLPAAQKAFERGIEHGSTEARFLLGALLARGLDGKPDASGAFAHYSEAAKDVRFPAAMREVGRCLFNGSGVEKNEVEALTWFRRAAKHGDATGTAFLGVAYETGRGVSADIAEAVKLYRAAAQAGSPMGMVHLAISLQRGSAAPENGESALQWFHQAAERKDRVAFLLLYSAYENGIGTPIDRPEAWKWLLLAAEAGSPEACARVGNAFHTGRNGAPSPAEAFHWYERAAELGHPTGISNLGCCYQFGHGVAVDFDRAFALYSRAAEMGDRAGLINLAICHEQGLGTPVDLEKARALRIQAATRPPK